MDKFEISKTLTIGVMTSLNGMKNDAMLRVPHTINTSNISVRCANIGHKFHVQVAKWLYINEKRTISYEVKYLL